MRERARSPGRRPGRKDPAGASRLLAEAGAHVAAGRLVEAAAAYARAERADPDDFRAPLSLATLDLRRGRPDLALPRLRRAAALQPQLFDAWHNLGAVSQALERWDEAADAYGQRAGAAPGRAGDAPQPRHRAGRARPHRRGRGRAPAPRREPGHAALGADPAGADAAGRGHRGGTRRDARGGRGRVGRPRHPHRPVVRARRGAGARAARTTPRSTPSRTATG